MKLVTIEWGSVKFIVPHKLSSDYCSFRQERKFKVQSGFENIGIVRRSRASDTVDQRPKANGDWWHSARESAHIRGSSRRGLPVGFAEGLPSPLSSTAGGLRQPP